jgi:unsaturated rhamnogalacturonyl hydrolase
MARMPRLNRSVLFGAFAAVLAQSLSVDAEEIEVSSSSLDARQLATTIRQVGDWQLSHAVEFDPRYWAIAPLYDGLIDASLVTQDPRYLAAVIRAGNRIGYELGSRRYHADGHAAGHAWLRIYEMMEPKRPQILARIKDQFDQIASAPLAAELSFGEEPPTGRRVTDRWTWADSLYMAPPTIGLLAKITGNDRYLRFVDAEFAFAYDSLFDPTDALFYRDARFVEQRTPSGAKVFWSRGNGWVYAGLALFLDSVPDEHPTRTFYVALFEQMSEAILATQQPQGYWYPSLKDPAHVPIPETSATALFVLGMAWGVRNGVIQEATYWPAVERGWNAIVANVSADGAVRSVQPPAREPKPFARDSHVAYGTGAALMAGAEILRAIGADPEVDSAALFRAANELATTAPHLSTTCEPPCDVPVPAAPILLEAR